jgi:arylsulfatase A-like enzyme
MAALLRLGEWLDFLREEGVFDNTRILIGAEHGFALWQYEDAVFDPSATVGDAMFFNPLFLFKDFGEKGLKRDDAFMTNADAPALLLQGLIENPVNPFTGKPITNSAKGTEDLLVTTSPDWQFAYNNGPAFFPAVWYRVTGPVLRKESWQLAGEW